MISDKSRLVLRINELFHDIEQADYDDKHADIFVDEKERWERFGENFLKHNENAITVLDIGSGTGFVPMNLAQYLKKKDTFICSDISENILNVCRDKMSREKFDCTFVFQKTNGLDLNLPKESINFVTMNSVLHHVPDINRFLEGINKTLKKGGKIIIGHEPNRLFLDNKFLWKNSRFFYFLTHPKNITIDAAKKIGFFSLIRKLYLGLVKKDGKHEAMIKKINDQLIYEKMINSPLTAEEIFELIDIHSPTAGGTHKSKGIDIKEIASEFDNLEIESLETYDHLLRTNSPKNILRKYSAYLAQKYPLEGSKFFVILNKK